MGQGPEAVVALLAEGVDRNYEVSGKLTQGTWSPSSRRAWIEIRAPSTPPRRKTVALLAEGVDRNVIQASVFSGMPSSPSSRRAWIEICTAARGSRQVLVALLAEGVDRNSPCHCRRQTRAVVALLAEGVDRNRDAGDAGPFSGQSPSSRRAWIEISTRVTQK